MKIDWTDRSCPLFHFSLLAFFKTFFICPLFTLWILSSTTPDLGKRWTAKRLSVVKIVVWWLRIASSGCLTQDTCSAFIWNHLLRLNGVLSVCDIDGVWYVNGAACILPWFDGLCLLRDSRKVAQWGQSEPLSSAVRRFFCYYSI